MPLRCQPRIRPQARAGFTFDAAEFRPYGSARELYNFHIDHAGSC
jgi:hypothetical protein